MRQVIALSIALAVSPAHAADPTLDAQLTAAERGAQQLGLLAADAVRAFAAPLPKPEAARARVVAGLYSRFIDECRRSFKIEMALEAKDQQHQDALVAHLACTAAAAKSLAPCDKLAPLAQYIKNTCAPDDKCVPQTRCRRVAGRLLIYAALIGNEGPGICAVAADSYDDVPVQLRLNACRAQFAAGNADTVCAGVGAALGGHEDASDMALCRAETAMRGAASEAACAEKNFPMKGEGDSFTEAPSYACKEAFRARKDRTCAATGDALATSVCSAAAVERHGKFAAEAAQAKDVNPRVAALEAFKNKHLELEALLARLDAALKASPRDEKQLERHRSARASVAASVKSMKAGIGR
ncbi:MAG: hypothetical protein HYV14_04535 [Elusimicrobia bacterium]|nr:hypothetical protein [Elusimicrobiota bacterium]